MTTIILSIIGILLAAAAALMVCFFGGAGLSFDFRVTKSFAITVSLPHLPFIMVVVGLLALILTKACRLYSLFMQRRRALFARTLSRHLCNPPQTWAAP
jgi:hypothetical protein